MGIDRWEQEHRNYRPGRPVAEVAPEDRVLDVPEDLPVAPETKNAEPKSPAAKRPSRRKPA